MSIIFEAILKLVIGILVLVLALTIVWCIVSMVISAVILIDGRGPIPPIVSIPGTTAFIALVIGGAYKIGEQILS